MIKGQITFDDLFNFSNNYDQVNFDQEFNVGDKFINSYGDILTITSLGVGFPIFLCSSTDPEDHRSNIPIQKKFYKKHYFKF